MLRAIIFRADRAAPWQATCKIPIPLEAGRVEVPQLLPTKISSATASRPANTPAAHPRQKEWRRHRVPSGSKAEGPRCSSASGARRGGDWQRESVRFENLPARIALQKRQESSRALFVPCTLENYSPLLNRGMRIRRDFPALAFSHRRGDCQRQRKNSSLRAAHRGELRGLRDIFPVNESPADLLVDSGIAQRRNGSTPVRCVLRIRDANSLNAGLQERFPAQLG